MLVIASLALAGCAAPTAAPTEVTTEEPAAVATTAPVEGEKLAVGVVLPTKDEPRWIQDETRFKDAFQAAGYDVQILFSQGDSAKEKPTLKR
jgi:putative multiple sugar transport system substrate-binding protein